MHDDGDHMSGGKKKTKELSNDDLQEDGDILIEGDNEGHVVKNEEIEMGKEGHRMADLERKIWRLHFLD